MSTSKRPSTVECQHPDCDAVGRAWQFDEYCTSECEVRHKGREVLEQFLYDHTRCFTCFRQLKTINPPKPDFEFTAKGHGWTMDEDGEPTLEFYSQETTRQAATGFQFLTEHSAKGEKQRSDRVITGTICDACGNTDHTHHDTALASRRAICRLVALLNDEDDVTFGAGTLHREYWRTQDIELAVGRALTD